MDFSGEKMQLLLPQGEIFSGLIFLDIHYFFIIGPQAVVMSAFCSKMVFVFYAQTLSQGPPMSVQQMTWFRS